MALGSAEKSLMFLAEKGDIPVVNTLMGLGSIPRSHELSYGLVGMHGFSETNTAVMESDLIIAVGLALATGYWQSRCLARQAKLFILILIKRNLIKI